MNVTLGIYFFLLSGKPSEPHKDQVYVDGRRGELPARMGPEVDRNPFDFAFLVLLQRRRDAQIATTTETPPTNELNASEFHSLASFIPHPTVPHPPCMSVVIRPLFSLPHPLLSPPSPIFAKARISLLFGSALNRQQQHSIQ